MSIPVPTNCSNKECCAPAIKLIHHSWQKVAIDAVDGAPVFAHLAQLPQLDHASSYFRAERGGN